MKNAVLQNNIKETITSNNTQTENSNPKAGSSFPWPSLQVLQRQTAAGRHTPSTHGAYLLTQVGAVVANKLILTLLVGFRCIRLCIKIVVCLDLLQNNPVIWNTRLKYYSNEPVWDGKIRLVLPPPPAHPPLPTLPPPPYPPPLPPPPPPPPRLLLCVTFIIPFTFFVVQLSVFVTLTPPTSPPPPPPTLVAAAGCHLAKQTTTKTTENGSFPLSSPRHCQDTRISGIIESRDMNFSLSPHPLPASLLPLIPHQ